MGATKKNLHTKWQGLVHQPALCIKEGIFSPDVRSFLFSKYEFCLHAWTLVQACCRVATTKISKLTAMPLVPVSLAFQHNSPPRQKETGSYKMVPLFGHKVQACKQNSYSGKNRNRLSIHPYKWRGDEKRWLMHTAPPFCKEKNSLEPNDSVRFSQDPAFYNYKMVAPTPWGEFQGG